MTCLFETKNSFKLTIQTLLTTVQLDERRTSIYGCVFLFTGPSRVDLHLCFLHIFSSG